MQFSFLACVFPDFSDEPHRDQEPEFRHTYGPQNLPWGPQLCRFYQQQRHLGDKHRDWRREETHILPQRSGLDQITFCFFIKCVT